MKSHAKLLTLCEMILKDFVALCVTAPEVELHRDLTKIKSRVRNEGLSFLTITLPNFCQGFERSLENGQVARSEFPGWKFTKSLPSFLKGLTSLVFDLATGRILESP